MTTEVETLLDILSQKTNDLKSYLSDFSETELHALPATDKWSAIMTVHHLYLAEFGSLAYCKKKLSFNPELDEVTDDQKTLESKLAHMLRSPKYKAQAPPGMSTEFLDNTLSLEGVFNQWDSLRSELQSFLEEQPETMYTKALYKHPMAGKMRLQGMLIFFEAHLDSHTAQIKGNFDSMANH